MSSDTAIEWADKVWNPAVGCTRVSSGCKNCYAFALHDMRHAAYQAGKKLPLQYAKPFTELQLMHDRLNEPLHWRKPKRVFVNSVSDLFHEDVPDEFIDRVFAVMALTPQHTYQVLTKRPERMLAYCDPNTRATHLKVSLESAKWPEELAKCIRAAAAQTDDPEVYRESGEHAGRWPFPNVWFGVSVENQQCKSRIDILRQVPANVLFLSLEPLLEDLGELDLTGISWCIVGGESGPHSRPMDLAWARSIVKQCRAANVACFVKQFGGQPRDNGKRFGPRDKEEGEFPRCWRCGHYDFGPCSDGTLLCNGCDAEWNRLADPKGGDPSEWGADLRVREFPR